MRKADEGIAERIGRLVKERIMSALHRHASIEVSGINVSVADGEVKLESTVGAYRERDLVVEAVRATGGVRDVVDNLRVGKTR
jgi:osmotically-inducible protein OsmY